MKVQTYEQVFGKPLTIKDLFDGFQENTNSGEVVAFGGQLNVRPPYQREFVYSMDKQQKVIETVLKEYPLNVMYWAKNDNGYELMDGQQRTLSLMKFAECAFTVDVDVAGKKMRRGVDDLKSDTDKFWDYPLTVYICDGDEDEKMAWFKVINIAGLRLSEQEMRNAVYNGPWVTSAKSYFSRVNGLAYHNDGLVYNGHTYSDYLDITGDSEKEKSVVRQALLELVLKWAVDAYNSKFNRKLTIDEYMDMHRNDPDAVELWRYYEDVMEWVKKTFPTYRKDMMGIDWGILYNKYHDCDCSKADALACDIFANAADEISNSKGVYQAVLSGDIKYIHAQSFKDADKRWAYKKQNGICPYCHHKFELKDMHGDHMIPWSKGGKTTRDNLQMLCAKCNIKKSNYDVEFKPWESDDYEAFDLEKYDAEMDGKA